MKLQSIKSIYIDIIQEQEMQGLIPNEKDKAISSKRQQHIVIKQSEVEHDFKLKYQWRDARIKFYSQSPQGVRDIQEIDKIFREKAKECLPIQFILQNKINCLRVIHIEYEPTINKYGFSQYRYSVEAFELFKIVHQNKQMKQVTIRGVLIQNLLLFLEQVQTTKKNSIKAMNNYADKQKWIREFNPPQSLRLNISAQVQFQIYDQQQTISRLSYLALFGRMFDEISGIKIVIILGYYDKIAQWRYSLQSVWRYLGTIKRIKLAIQGNDYISPQFTEDVRSILFGGLSSLTNITQIFFKYIRLSQSIEINTFLSLEQSLANLFQNNTITHLLIDRCISFTIFPQMATILYIYLSNMTFRKQFFSTSQLANIYPSLKYLYVNPPLKYDWQIEEQLFNHLQSLIVRNCSFISFKYFTSNSLSNIKYLSIQKSGNRNVDGLPLMFPKLLYLTQLYLFDINCGHQLLCTIPSPSLKELYIECNSVITDQGLMEIDQKWPQLIEITLRHCDKVTENFLKICKFKGLVELRISRTMGQESRKYLKSRGIRYYS